MGLVYADITLLNAEETSAARRGKISPDAVKRIEVKALVDSGAYMMCINESVKQQLDLVKISESTAELADESVIKVDVVGPIEIRFKNRITIANAAVLPGNSEILLGAIPMEGLDVIITPKLQTLEVNPESPTYAKTKIK